METIFMHGKTESGRRFTVAGVSFEGKLLIGLAVCNPKDQFCKKIGRNIAEGRSFYDVNPYELSNDFKKNFKKVNDYAVFISKFWKYPFNSTIIKYSFINIKHETKKI